jgi:glutaredoxin
LARRGQMIYAGRRMLELYQSELCPECTAVRRKLADLGATYVVRTVPMDRRRRERVIEAGGRPDIPLLIDEDRGRSTYDVDEIVAQLADEDLVPPEDADAPGLAHLHQREGEAESDKARKLLGAAGVDFVVHEAKKGDRDVPRLVDVAGAVRTGLAAIEDWANAFRPR